MLSFVSAAFLVVFQNVKNTVINSTARGKP